jgi:hypothetical protein
MGRVAVALLLAVSCATVGAEEWGDTDGWQANALFQPSPGQLERERAGRVMIYDGLTDKEVTRALDTQFDRVDSMMFVNVVRTDEAGEPVRDSVTGEILSSDDCD